MNLKGSKTEKNLYKTFAGESRARTKYTFYEEVARSECNMWIAEVFEETSNNELAHARRVMTDFLDKIKSTKLNLLDAIMGESEEYRSLYKNFEKEARDEGFDEIADFYKELQEVEESHAEKFKKLYNRIEEGKLYKDSPSSKWICMNCGYIYEGEEAPLVCPLCKFPRGYFKIYSEEDS